jgi:hypothetical protein
VNYDNHNIKNKSGSLSTEEMFAQN